ncbi:MAG: hypothetical protein PWQ70_3343 [Clostridiales bacterium]|nr:hypothetical protein [Clostridiales bacterium]
MKVALVGEGNKSYMPYMENYQKILRECGVNYDVINWDRLCIEEVNEIAFRDNKRVIPRNFLDYVKYGRFVASKLHEYEYEKVVVFGIALAYFIRKILKKNYCNKYIFDIRDDHKMRKFLNIKQVIECSYFTVLSSPSYEIWLPKSYKYVINHNTTIGSLNELRNVDINLINEKQVVIANIGSIRDYQINIDLINALKNNNNIVIKFHGQGAINEEIEKYIKLHNIANVELTGKYEKDEEESFYLKADMINVLRYNDSINNKTALPNRLYKAAIYGKPLLAFEGTYLSKIISKYDLGLVVNSFKNMEEKIWDYICSFDVKKYEQGRHNFFKRVIKDNETFRERFKKFLER